MTELQVLSNCIILKLISSFKKFVLKFFRGFIHPRNFFNNENFPDYGTSHVYLDFVVVMIAFVAIVLRWTFCNSLVVNLPLTAEARLVHTYTGSIYMVLLSIGVIV